MKFSLLACVTLALATFTTGLGAGLLSRWVYDVSQPAPQTVQATVATPTPRQDPKTAYYIGVYDTCKLFAIKGAGETDEAASIGCLGFVQRANEASWYEASDK